MRSLGWDMKLNLDGIYSVPLDYGVQAVMKICDEPKYVLRTVDFSTHTQNHVQSSRRQYENASNNKSEDGVAHSYSMIGFCVWTDLQKMTANKSIRNLTRQIPSIGYTHRFSRCLSLALMITILSTSFLPRQRCADIRYILLHLNAPIAFTVFIHRINAVLLLWPFST